MVEEVNLDQNFNRDDVNSIKVNAKALQMQKDDFICDTIDEDNGSSMDGIEKSIEFEDDTDVE